MVGWMLAVNILQRESASANVEGVLTNKFNACSTSALSRQHNCRLIEVQIADIFFAAILLQMKICQARKIVENRIKYVAAFFVFRFSFFAQATFSF